MQPRSASPLFIAGCSSSSPLVVNHAHSAIVFLFSSQAGILNKLCGTCKQRENHGNKGGLCAGQELVIFVIH